MTTIEFNKPIKNHKKTLVNCIKLLFENDDERKNKVLNSMNNIKLDQVCKILFKEMF